MRIKLTEYRHFDSIVADPKSISPGFGSVWLQCETEVCSRFLGKVYAWVQYITFSMCPSC